MATTATILHQHVYARRAIGQSQRWQIYCATCKQVIISDMSEEGTRVMVEIMSDHCKEPGCYRPRYVNDEGIGNQKPYIAALCVEHIYEKFQAIGIFPPIVAPKDRGN